MHFLRVEVVLQDATYFIVFTDADTIPPTIRVDNYSEVPLQFHQACLETYTMPYIAAKHILFSQYYDSM
jgi:vacuolar protein sorting-associated protein 13D